MSTGSGAVTASGSGGLLEDDFERSVAAGSLPTGWGTGDIGTWEESSYSSGESSAPYQARVNERVNGSEGVIDYKSGLVDESGMPTTYRAYDVDTGPLVIFAGPYSLDDKGYVAWPFEVTFDLRFDVFIEPDDPLWAETLGYMDFQFGVLVLSDADVADALGYRDDAMLHYTNIWDSADYAAYIELWANSTATAMSLEAWTYYTSSDNYNELNGWMDFASFVGTWWRFKMYVDADGIKVKMYPRDQTEPDELTVWDYDDPGYEPRETVSWTSGGFTYVYDPEEWNALGFEFTGPYIYIQIPARYWEVCDTWGYSKGWAYSDPQNGYAYPVGWPSESHGFARIGNPTYHANICWPSFTAGPCVQIGQGQEIACWSQVNGPYAYDPSWDPKIPSEVESVTVRGTVRVGVGGYPETGGPTSGWLTVQVLRYSYGYTEPATDSQKILGGEVVATVSVWWTVEQGWFPTSSSSRVYFEFTSTRDQLTADGLLQWGVFIPDAAALRCADGRVSGGICQPNWGSYSAAVGGPNPVWNEQYEYWENGTVEYDVTYVDSGPTLPPDNKFGEWRVDNVSISGGALTTVYGQ